MYFGRRKRYSENESSVEAASREKDEKKTSKKSKQKASGTVEMHEESDVRNDSRRKDVDEEEERRKRFEAKKKKEEKRRVNNHKKEFSAPSVLQRQPQPMPGTSRGMSFNGGAIPKVDLQETTSTKSKSVSMNSTSAKPKPQKAPSRFSLRRFFYGNPLLAQPFLQSPLAAHSSFSRHRRRQRSQASGGAGASSAPTPGSLPARQEDASSWRDNISSCSSLQSGGMTSVGPDGKIIRECPLCLSRVTLDMFPLLRNCPHLFCLECLQFYVKIELQEGRVNIKCPQCVEPMHPNDIESLIGDKNSNLLKLYEFLMLRRLLSTDPDTRWCPGPNCTYAVIAAGCASCPRIQCERPGCGSSFCYHCKAEWHPNQTCDMARAIRQPTAMMVRAASVSFSQESGLHTSEVKVCPRCNVLIVKMDDGSCNHMTCAVCAAEFCWLCMKEISDLHYLSPSGCTFWGKKPWSRKKKLMWQLGTLVGAPVGIAMLAGISVPAMIIGIPVWVGRKLHAKYSLDNRHKRNLAITGGVVASIVVSPLLAGIAVSIGVPILLAYVYGVVPISLCRSEGCGVSTSGAGVKIDVDEEMPYRPMVLGSQVANPSIGEVSLGASLSMGSACHLEEDRGHEASGAYAGAECDRESASNTAIAGTSRTVSLASSFINAARGGGGSEHHRLEVGADVHSRKKFSMSSERLSETVSLSERSATVSLAENDGTASTRALAGSILAYRMCADSQSVGSYRMTAGQGDEISLRSLPNNGGQSNQRSLSPVSNMSGDELGGGGARRSTRRRPHLDKQLSENSSLISAEDATSERVRFDDNISFIDERGAGASCGVAFSTGASCATTAAEEVMEGVGGVTFLAKGHKPSKLDTPAAGILPEETAEELALVISPEPRRNPVFGGSGGNNVTLLSIGGGNGDEVSFSSSSDRAVVVPDEFFAGDTRLEISVRGPASTSSSNAEATRGEERRRIYHF